MSTIICKYEYDVLNDFQKELHFVNDQSDITSVFYKEYRKTMWYAQSSVKLKCTGSGESELSYTVNNMFHELLYTYMRQNFPALRVKSNWANRVQICWTHNMGTNIVQQGRLKFDDDVPQTIDSVWYDIYSQFYMKPGFRAHYDVCVGNLPILEDWTTNLPEYTTNIIQPFYHAVDACRAIQLFYFSSLASITYNYKVRNNISEMLRMRCRLPDKEFKDEKGNVIRKDPIWKEYPVNLKYIEGAGPSATLKTPEVWGRYAYLSDEEIEWYKMCEVEEVVEGDKKVMRSKDKVIYIEDVVSCNSTNPQMLGSSVQVDLDCKTPAKAIFFVSENLTARNNRSFSNYTTCADNLYKGWNPNKAVTLAYGGSHRLDNMDIDHFDKIECWKHFPSPPSEPGYNAYSFAYDSTSLDADVGIVMNEIKAKLLITLGNTDPHLKPIKVTEDEGKGDLEELESDRVSDRTGDRFVTHVRLLVTRKMTISKLTNEKFEITLDSLKTK